MTILVDFSQVIISNLMMNRALTKAANKNFIMQDNQILDPFSEPMVRHMVLNSLRSYRSKFRDKFGELVICCDSRNVWRKEFFPLYKAHRKSDREESELNWDDIFTTIHKITDEIRDNLPYKVVTVEGAEADDVIATLVHKYGEYMNVGEQILIISGDKDFQQLQKYANVTQYGPVQKKMLATNNPERFKKEHIMQGDKSDGIPNFLSPDDAIVAKKRQRPITQANLDKWVLQDPEKFCTGEMLRGYKRNEMLVDLDKIPEKVSQAINTAFEEAKTNPRSKILNYFIKQRLRNLMESIGDF